MSTTQWYKNSRGGTMHSHTFSSDSKYLFVASGSKIKMYSVMTGKQTRTLQGDADVVAILPDPNNKFQIFSFHANNTLVLWDYNDINIFRVIDLPCPVSFYQVHPIKKNIVYGAYNNNGLCHFFNVDLISGESEMMSMVYESIAGFTVTADGKNFVIVKNSSFTIYSINDTELTERNTFQNSRPITCFAMEPKGLFFATGDQRGEIRFWYCFNQEFNGGNKNTKVFKTFAPRLSAVRHWHSHAVGALHINSVGTYLLSGGHENILVVWQLQTAERKFIPNFYPAITGIVSSPNEAFYAVIGHDNSIIFVDASAQKLKKKIQGPYIQRNTGDRNIVISPKRNQFAYATDGGSIQFYDLLGDKNLFYLQVSKRQFHRINEDNEDVPEPRVTHMRFEQYANWLATVEYREDNNHVNLKFWRYRDKGGYHLHTVVKEPHDAAITDLAYHPTLNIAVTCSFDKKFKIWEWLQSSNSWQCKSVGTYLDHVPSSAIFSNDGSLLIIAFGNIITFWNHESHSFHDRISLQSSNEVIRGMLQISHFLVVHTDYALYVWNLLTMSVTWSFHVRVAFIEKDYRSNRFAIYSPGSEENQGEVSPLKEVDLNIEQFADERGLLVLFDVHSPRPIWHKNIEAGESVKSINFYPSDKSKYECNFIYIMQNDVINVLSDNIDSEFAKMEKAINENPLRELPSVFTQLYGNEISTVDDEPIEIEFEASKSSQELAIAMRSVFTGPSHALPPTNILFDSFMSHLLSKKSKTAHAETIPEKETLTAMDISEDDDLMKTDEIIPISNPFTPNKSANTNGIPKVLTSVNTKRSQLNILKKEVDTRNIKIDPYEELLSAFGNLNITLEIVKEEKSAVLKRRRSSGNESTAAVTNGASKKKRRKSSKKQRKKIN